MKRIMLYILTIVIAGFLGYIAELWYEGDKILGVLTVVIFALFLLGWKRTGSNGIGLIFVTVFYLITIDSIFFVQDIPIFIGSLVMGLLLIPYLRKHPDAVSASLVFVVLNMLISLEFVSSEVMMWLIVLVTGAAALMGFRFNLNLVKISFSVLFGLSAFFLLLFEVFDDFSFLAVLAILLIVFFVMGMYKMNKHVAV